MRRKARFCSIELRSFFEMSGHSFPNHKYHKSSKGQLMSCKLKVKHDAGHLSYNSYRLADFETGKFDVVLP